MIGGCQNENRDKKVEQTNWAPEHSELLRELVARGLSYAEIANAINAKFRTCYSRNAAIGRAKRMGITESDRAKPQPLPRQPPLDKILERRPSESRASEFRWPMPNFERAEPVALRCVEVDPRHLSLLELEREIADILTAAMRRARPLRFAGIRAARVRAIARPIFI